MQKIDAFNHDNQVFIMQTNAKKIDDKLLTLTKMRSTLRNKKVDYLTFLEANTLEFPQIANVLVTFPLVKCERNEIKNSHKRKSIVELDRYLENHHDRITQDDANRIIFASPLRNRITFQKTFFRRKANNTIELQMGRKSQNLSLDGKKDSERSGNSLAPYGFAAQVERFSEFRAKLIAELSDKVQKGRTKYNSMTIVNPEERKKSFIERLDLKRGNANKIKIKRKEQALGRYSPWRSQELQDQLIL